MITEQRKAELKELAVDTMAGRVFWDQFCSPDDFFTVFMLLPLMDEEQMASFRARSESGEIAAIYEYLDKAGPRSINGKPVFLSLQILNAEELEEHRKIYKRLMDAQQKALEDPS